MLQKNDSVLPALSSVVRNLKAHRQDANGTVPSPMWCASSVTVAHKPRTAGAWFARDGERNGGGWVAATVCVPSPIDRARKPYRPDCTLLGVGLIGKRR